jgi:hypothetical protein
MAQPQTMKIKLTQKRRSTGKDAGLAGHTPAEFLNRYLADNMAPLFGDPRKDDLETNLGTLEYHTRADAERVVAWMEKRVAECSEGRTAFDVEIFEYDGIFWIEATIETADGFGSGI